MNATRSKATETTDEQPVTVRLSTKAWATFFVAQFAFIVSTVGAASVWAADIRHDIVDNRLENDRQNVAIEKLAAALKDVADSGAATARTLERVQGRLETGK